MVLMFNIIGLQQIIVKYQTAAKRNTGHQLKELVDCISVNWKGSRGPVFESVMMMMRRCVW